jgi:Fungal Zn(2)-Cys(6) binuclear cluster domain
MGDIETQLKLNTASRSRPPRRENRRFACDFCRKRKTKCNMPLVIGIKPRSGLDVFCSNCTLSGVDCTFGNIQTQKCVPKQSAGVPCYSSCHAMLIIGRYVAGLENRQEQLQWLLGKVCGVTINVERILTCLQFCSLADIVAQVGPYIKPWMDGTCSSKSSDQRKLRGCKDNSSVVKSVSPTSKDDKWPPFPPEDLLQTLVNVYFSKVNVVWPLLHRPSFEADLLKERHRRDLGFACVVLAACAVASRYCLDSRVLANVRYAADPHSASSDTTPMPWNGPNPWTDDLEQGYAKAPLFAEAPLFSAGWKYFDRIQRFRVETTTEVTLCELQVAHVSRYPGCITYR